jgi:hypothetical protein
MKDRFKGYEGFKEIGGKSEEWIGSEIRVGCWRKCKCNLPFSENEISDWLFVVPLLPLLKSNLCQGLEIPNFRP